MVARCLMLIGLITCLNAAPALAASTLEATVSRADKQWGQYVSITLKYHGNHKLDEIDLRRWQTIAAIIHEDEYTDSDEKGRQLQVKVLRLYPRSMGKHVLPELMLGNARTSPVTIIATQPQVEESALEVSWHISSKQSWQREAVKLQVQLKTSDYSAHLELGRLENDAVISHVIPTSVHQSGKNYIHSSGWMIYPLRAGKLMLDMPPIRYRLSGSDRRQFYLPLVDLNIQALPTYIPPILPVGTLNITSAIHTTSNTRSYWEIKVNSEALIPYGVPGLDKQLALISQRDIADVAMITSGSPNSVTYRAALPQWLLPVGKNLTLTSRYFNPATGKLDNIKHNLPRTWHMPGWATLLMTILLLLVIVVMGRILMPHLNGKIQHVRLRANIRQATSAHEVRQLILAHSQAVTLSDWAGANNARIRNAVELNRYCYSQTHGNDIETLKTAIETSI